MLPSFSRVLGRAVGSAQGMASRSLQEQSVNQLPLLSACHRHASSYNGYTRERTRATTILCVRKDGQVVMVGDGQVSQGDTIAKPNAKKVRRIGESVVCGFAGSAADGLTLLERLETKLEEHPGQLMRAAVELAKVWRQDKALRFLQAELLVADATTTLTVSGNGDVLEPHDGIMAIGSGGRYAVAAARALVDIAGMDAMTIARRSMKIASDMCVYTNSNFVEETLAAGAAVAGGGSDDRQAAKPGDSPDDVLARQLLRDMAASGVRLDKPPPSPE